MSEPHEENLISVGDCAKLYSFRDSAGNLVGRNRLFEILRCQGIILPSSSAHNRPSQKLIDAGMFVLRAKYLANGEIRMVPFFTIKGFQWIGGVMERLGYTRVPVEIRPPEPEKKDLFAG